MRSTILQNHNLSFLVFWFYHKEDFITLSSFLKQNNFWRKVFKLLLFKISCLNPSSYSNNCQIPVGTQKRPSHVKKFTANTRKLLYELFQIAYQNNASLLHVTVKDEKTCAVMANSRFIFSRYAQPRISYILSSLNCSFEQFSTFFRFRYSL